MIRNFVILLSISLLCSCSSVLTSEEAHELISESSAFRTPFFAPFTVGPQMLTSDESKSADDYIKEKYGKLIDAGLVEVKMVGKNSWRTIISVDLTAKGKSMADMRRSDHDHIYVMVCSLATDRVEGIEHDSENKTARVQCCFYETSISPFGEYLGFSEGKSHKAPFVFVRSGSSWELASRQQDYQPEKLVSRTETAKIDEQGQTKGTDL